jgi:hypothetical protein
MGRKWVSGVSRSQAKLTNSFYLERIGREAFGVDLDVSRENRKRFCCPNAA